MIKNTSTHVDDDQFHSDRINMISSYREREGGEMRKSCSTGSHRPAASSPSLQAIRVFVGTWNVGGRIPSHGGGQELGKWLLSSPGSPPADIYVLGFQEIVPLNAGNILGLGVVENHGPPQNWLSLIHQALNSQTCPTTRTRNDLHAMDPKFSDQATSTSSSDEEYSQYGDSVPMDGGGGGYDLAASKQMVGIFMCVWVRDTLMQYVSNLSVSCVGTGIMGFMGNKGSVSISLTVRGTTLCFVCSHLASGEKEGDQLRRNSDVSQILKRTRFTPSHNSHSHSHGTLSPNTISQHDRIIWLGDLNYRLAAAAAGCRDIQALLQRKDWQGLLHKDQLRMEQRAGRVFTGWEEGRIGFPPTYKYLFNSDVYAIRQYPKSATKRRTPAWCDRILWRGKGMKQLCYLRDESRFSDHRPVYSVFDIEIDNYYREEEGAQEENKSLNHDDDYTKLDPRRRSTTTAAVADHTNGRLTWGKVQAEEMLLLQTR